MKVYSNFIDSVSITVNNISQMLNPKTIVINSVIIENISESISIIKNNLHSQIMNLDILTLSKFRSKTNILGLTHVLIQDFLNIDNYTPKDIKRDEL
jgi:predicted NBD/HSP70 family sugar kinase